MERLRTSPRVLSLVALSAIMLVAGSAWIVFLSLMNVPQGRHCALRYISSMANNKRRKKMRSNRNVKKKAARKTVTAAAKRSSREAISGKKVRRAAKKKGSSRSAPDEIRSPEPSTLGGRIFSPGVRRSRIGMGSNSAGQSGDVQQLSRKAVVDSESVEELLEEGQAREAAAISGVEGAADPDQAQVRTRQVPEDDVPEEYTDDN